MKNKFFLNSGDLNTTHVQFSIQMVESGSDVELFSIMVDAKKDPILIPLSY